MHTPKPPTVLAATAVVVAVLGSTPIGSAAGRLILPHNSVGNAQLKVGAVTAAKIKDGTLTAAKFKADEFAAGAQGAKGDLGVQGAKGDTGPQGAKGATGTQGPAGEQGPEGETGPAGAQGDKGEKGDKGDPGTGTTAFAAGLSSGGLVAAKSKGAVSAIRLGAGSYRVTFAQDITHCAYFATMPQNQDSFASAWQYVQDTASTLTVSTFALPGGGLTSTDRFYSVGIIC